MKISFKQITNFATLLFFSVALNPEWSANPILWWGSIVFVLGMMLISYGFRIPLQINAFQIWMIAFFLICMLSIIVAIDRSTSIACLKTLGIFLVILFIIDELIQTECDLKIYMKLYLIATFLMIGYVFIKLDLTSFQLAQRGLVSTGVWNGNEVGIKCALFIILMLYFWDRNDKPLICLLKCISMGMALILVYFTASRKALLMIAIGVSLYFYLKNPTKKARNICIIVGGIFLVYFALMHVSLLYNAIGWRIDGFIAGLTGKGSVDSSTALRSEYISIGIDAFKNSPFFGYGLDNYRFINLHETGHFTYSHNNFIEILVGVGIFGFIVYYFFYLKLIKEYLVLYRKNQTSQILNIIAICFVTLWGMHFACVSYTSFEQALIILFMFKALGFNNREVEVSNKSKKDKVIYYRR